MKKLLLSLGVLTSFALSAQNVLLSDDFESYPVFENENIGDWTMIDGDMSATYGFNGITFNNIYDTMAFIIFNPLQTTPPMATPAPWSAKSGSKSIICFAATTPPNNDWLISPQIQLGASGNVVSFWAKSATVEFGQERFKVGVSTGGTAQGDFTTISSGNFVQVGDTWTFFFYNLDANYAGQNVRIAINCVSNDAFGFMVDDFVVASGVVNTEEYTTEKVMAFPNPANDVLNVISEGEEIVSLSIISMDGKIVSTIEGSIADVSGLTAGMYIYEATTTSGVVVRNSFIKK
jgi:hypothetical protein